MATRWTTARVIVAAGLAVVLGAATAGSALARRPTSNYYPPTTTAPDGSEPGSEPAGQPYVVPDGVQEIQIEAAGGAGGAGGTGGCLGSVRSPGGEGGRVTATFAVAPGDVLYVHVGGRGIDGETSCTAASPGGAGGSGGGGAGGGTTSSRWASGGGGGGASDVRRGGDTPADRIVVAGGGGGGGAGGSSNGVTTFADGGDGGGPAGARGQSNQASCADPAGPGSGGTAAAPGFGGAGGGSGTSGAPGTGRLGGTGAMLSLSFNGGLGGSGGGGGGGGWFGGGGGGAHSCSSGGGGGGSGYVHPDALTAANEVGGNTGDGSVTITPLGETGTPVDETGPLASVTFGSGWSNTSPVAGALSADDAERGDAAIAGFTCTGADVSAFAADGTSATATATVSGDGVHEVSCTATDGNGNTSAPVTATVRIDTVAPTLVPTVTPASIPVGGSATVLPSATDGGSGLASSSCTAPNTTSVGSRTVTCTATDLAGNVATAEVPYQVVAADRATVAGSCGPVTFVGPARSRVSSRTVATPVRPPRPLQDRCGAFETSIGGLRPGATARITVKVPIRVQAWGAQQSNGAYTLVVGPWLAQRRVVLSVADGSRLDVDGARNGTVLLRGAPLML